MPGLKLNDILEIAVVGEVLEEVVVGDVEEVDMEDMTIVVKKRNVQVVWFQEK